MSVDPVERVRLELVTRRMSIQLLGVMTTLVGAVTMMTGAPSFIEDAFSPWSRVLLGALAFLPGLLVAIGGSFDDRRWCVWWLQVFGLLGVAAWFALMCGTYVWYTFDVVGIDFLKIGQPLASHDQGRAYVPLIYLVLFTMTLVPLITMLRIGQPEKPSDD